MVFSLRDMSAAISSELLFFQIKNLGGPLHRFAQLSLMVVTDGDRPFWTLFHPQILHDRGNRYFSNLVASKSTERRETWVLSPEGSSSGKSGPEYSLVNPTALRQTEPKSSTLLSEFWLSTCGS